MILPAISDRQIRSSLRIKLFNSFVARRFAVNWETGLSGLSKNAFAKDLLTDAFNRSNRPNSFRVVSVKVKPHHLVC